MPQSGHVPGPARSTSGCIGHVYSTGPPPGRTAGRETVGARAATGARARPVKASGSASKAILQCRQQK